MSSGLWDLLGLPELRRAEFTTQGEEFYQAFREGMSRLNGTMQQLAAQARPEDLQALAVQRIQLYEAYQKASQLIDPVDPAKADPAIQRVMAAVNAVESKAISLADEVMRAREEWLMRAGEFDDSLMQISELQLEGHPKADALQKVGETIRTRANERNYDESVAALDQLRPKLDQIYAEYQQQVGGDGQGPGDSGRGDGEAGDIPGELRGRIEAHEAAFDADVDTIIQAHSVQEVGQSVSGLIDGDWGVVDGLNQTLGVVTQGYLDARDLPDDLKKAARGVGVEVLMRGARKVVENRELIKQASHEFESHMDSDLMKLLTLGNPLLEPGREIALRMARAGAQSPDVAQQLLENEEDIRALAAMDSREAAEQSLKQIDVGETFETELHGTVAVHAELGVKVGAQVSSKAKKVDDNTFEVEIQLGAKAQGGVGAGAQGEGAAGDVGVGGGGKLVVKVEGNSPEEARAQVATLMQMANGDNRAMERIAQLNGVTIKEAEGTAAALASGDLTVGGVELRGEVVQDYKLIGNEPGEPHVGVAARLAVKGEIGGPVNIAVPDDVASLGESPAVKDLDPRLRALLGDMPVDVARQIENAYGKGGGLKIGGEVQVEAHLYAPTSVGAPLLVQGGLVANANRLELTYKGKLEAGNTNVELTHQVVVKDLQGLSKKIDMSADELAVAMQDGVVSRDELVELIPDPEERDKYLDFNSKAEIGHFDGVKIDAFGFGGHIGESNKLTVYEMKDGEMVEKVDDIPSEFEKMEEKTKFELPRPDDHENEDDDSDSWTEWITDPGKKLDELRDDAGEAYDEAKEKYDEMKDEAMEKYEQVKDEAIEEYEEIKEDAVEKYEEVRDDVVEEYEETKEEVAEAIDDAKDVVKEAASDPLGFMKDKLF